MALGPRLDIRQSQSLVMTPQLQQAIKLLALSNLEVEAFVAAELEKNPLLEAGEPQALSTEPPDGMAPPERPTLSAETGAADDLMRQGLGQADAPLDADYGGETFINDGPADRAVAGGWPDGLNMPGAGSGEAIDFDSFASADQGLQEHLMDQARNSLSGIDLLIATHLIGQIDEAGYLEANLLESAHALGMPLARVEQVLQIIQGFDPTGVGARTLAECLALQAREADRYDPCMAKLFANLDLLARGAIPQLRRLCGVDEEDMADMIRELRGYDPKPGLRHATERLVPVTPDLFIKPTRDGWSIEINTATLPRVLVNRSYYVELAGATQDRTAKGWLADCLASANWLVKALDQRQRTIIKVATEIVRCQEDFFRKGVAHLKPLTLKTVAEAIGMHESTVSRVTSNKYLACPRGVYELKYFFTSGVAAADGEGAVSAEAVKSHIKALIAAEAPGAILSDDTLVDLLRAKGMDIARRTVAKYRESMGIGSSVQRRRQKALQGKAA